MNALFEFFANRRKALGYIVAALAEYITALLPQANPQNAQVLHAIVLALGFLLVYLPENVKAAVAQASPEINSFIDGLVKGDNGRHQVTEPAPATVSVPPAPAAVPQG